MIQKQKNREKSTMEMMMMINRMATNKISRSSLTNLYARQKRIKKRKNRIKKRKNRENLSKILTF